MLWTTTQEFLPYPFDKEIELETAIAEIQQDLFGNSRAYLKVKKLIGQAGKTQNIPDGYLLDFSSPKKPVLYIIEVELGKHDPLRHIAQQLLGFSLSFKSSPQKMKGILRNTVQNSAEIVATCEQYAASNGFNNIDYLLEQMIYPGDAFNALVIIDDLEEELESVEWSNLNSLGEPMKAKLVLIIPIRLLSRSFKNFRFSRRDWLQIPFASLDTGDYANG